mgnify:CR=1 FL=1
MAKRRNNVPKKIKETVLKEYKHKCAICGANDPQLHHIDENPSNNGIENLIPLCPNCHLKDQHNPTAGIDIGILKLFRKYKDPVILSHQFVPIYRRFNYLYDLKDEDNIDSVKGRTNELIGFIRHFGMGDFYAHQIERLLRDPINKLESILNKPEVKLYGANDKIKYVSEHYGILRENIEKAESLIVELLRYQNWIMPANYQLKLTARMG